MTSLDLGKSRGRPRARGFTELGGRGRSPNPGVRREQKSLRDIHWSPGWGGGGGALRKTARRASRAQANAAEGVRYSVCLQGGGQKRTNIRAQG